MSRPAVHRLHKMDSYIRQGNYPSVGFLADKLEVSTRTVHRDLEFLKEQWGAPLRFDGVRKGYCYTESSWFIPAVPLTEQELIALLIAKHAILHYAGVPYDEHLRRAFKKITESLPEDKAINLGEVEETFSFRFGAARKVDSRILDTVSGALKNRHSIKIVYYAAGKDEVNERTVDPYHLD
ncbi:MAG: HTH domain-containing protein, partial [Armatimonadetes bacterium]|nr:HTH domain-containing protein [Armatimonadota bacterium]